MGCETRDVQLAMFCIGVIESGVLKRCPTGQPALDLLADFNPSESEAHGAYLMTSASPENHYPLFISHDSYRSMKSPAFGSVATENPSPCGLAGTERVARDARPRRPTDGCEAVG